MMSKDVLEEKQFSDRIASRYDDMVNLYSPYNQLGTKRRVNDLKKIIGNYKPSSVLEIGCGTGEELVLLMPFTEANCRDIVGIDISEGMLRVTQSKLPDVTNAQLVVADALQLPFKERIFDIVFCIATLHHLPDLHTALGEMHHVIKEGGTLYIEERVNNKLFDVLRRLGIRSKAKVSPHEMTVGSSISHLLTEVGTFFQIESIEFRSFAGVWLAQEASKTLLHRR